MKQIMIITRKDLKPIIDKLRELDKKLDKFEEKTKIPNCIYCGSTKVIRNGWRYNNNKKVQKYRCQNCNHKFSCNDDFKRMRNNAEVILKAMELRKKGKTFAQISEALKKDGTDVTRQSICKWMQEYQPATKEITVKRNQKNQFGEYEREFKIKI